MRRILHADMDAFYASVEQRDHPEWKGRPVIVGADPRNGRGRGVVAACSYEARRFGVHSALPISRAWRLCPEGVYVRPRFDRYREISGQVMAIFRDFTDMVEPLSIDEAFLDVTGSETLLGPADQIALRIKERIRRETELTASVGVAGNKFLAKIASDLRKPDALVVVPDDEIEAFLDPLPVSRLWGVGPKTAVRIRRLGVGTIGELRRIPLATLGGVLGSSGEHLWRLAHGRDERPVVTDSEPKSISSETTFAEDTSDRTRLVATLQRLSDQVASRLRQKHCRARRLMLKLRYASFRTFNRQVSIDAPTDDGTAIFRRVRRLFDSFDLDEPVRLLGVGAAGLVRHGEAPAQMDLFDLPGKELALALDEIHKRFGDASLHRASDLS